MLSERTHHKNSQVWDPHLFYEGGDGRVQRAGLPRTNINLESWKEGEDDLPTSFLQMEPDGMITPSADLKSKMGFRERKCGNSTIPMWKVHAKSLQSCPTLCDAMDCSPPGSSFRGVLQARILEWVAMPSTRGSPPGTEPTSLTSPALAGGFFTTSAIWEASGI